jgi:hypothetical protein
MPSIPMDTLDKGLHTLFVRFLDNGNNWSSTMSQFFYKPSDTFIPQGGNKVTAFRYWIDTLNSSAVEVPLPRTTAQGFILDEKNFANLDTGFHHIYIQYKDSLQLWSEVRTDSFFQLGESRIDRITPNKGGNTGDVTVKIHGTGFFEGTSVKLTRVGFPDLIVPDSLVTITNGQIIYATLDLRGQTTGVWDVVVTVPNDTSMTAENGFEVVEGSSINLWTKIVGFDAIHFDTWQTYSIVVGNDANEDARGVPLWFLISSDAKINFLFDVAIPDSMVFSDTIIVGGAFPLFVQIDSLEGQPFDGNLYGFIVPLVSANSTVTYNFQLKIPGSVGSVEMVAWTTAPLYGSPLKIIVGECWDFLTDLVLGSIPLEIGCAYNAFNQVVTPLMDAIILTQGVPLDPKKLVISYTLNWINTVASCLDLTGVSNIVGRTALFISYLSGAISYFNDPVNPLSPDCWCTVQSPLPWQWPGDNCLFWRRPHVRSQIKAVSSYDPNAKVGPIGASMQRYYSSSEPFTYYIHFENKDTATAKAQNVLVVDTLDTSKFDMNTFELGFINLADEFLYIPAGSKEFSTKWDLRSKHNVIVDVHAALDESTGILTCKFSSLDPVNLEPISNPYDGFLPPNVVAPDGEGSLFFTIRAKENIPNETPVSNRAYIYFDNNPPIATETWTNVIDDERPESEVLHLAAYQTDTTFTVSWIGMDTISGIKSYSVFASENDGPYYLWLPETYSTQAVFTGKVDSTYRFYSIAVDSAGNVEAAPMDYDAITHVELTNVDDAVLEKHFRLIPNPTSGKVTLQLDGVPISETIIEVDEMTGRTILQYPHADLSAGTFHMDFSGQRPGIYLVKILVGDGWVTKRLLVFR